jgi:hypothetical protein
MSNKNQIHQQLSKVLWNFLDGSFQLKCHHYNLLAIIIVVINDYNKQVYQMASKELTTTTTVQKFL